MLTGVYETLRSAGRDLTLELGEHAGVAERLAELQEVARALAADPDATDKQLAAANVALALGSNPEQLLDLSELAAAGDRAAEFRAARDRLQQAALEELAARDSELLQELLNLFAAEYAGVEAARVGARLRGPAALRTRPAARPRADPRRRAAAVPLDHGRRVPGHEPAAVRGRRPAARRAGRAGRLLRRRRVPVDLRLPARRRRRLPRAARGRGAAAAADAQLPLAARGARRRQPPVPRGVRRGLPGAGRVRGVRRSRVRSSGRAARQPTRRATAKPARRWREGEANAIARRVRELVDSGAAAPGEIVLLFAAGTDAERYESALRAQGLPTYRATGRGYFGQQQVVDLLSYLRLLHNRYDDEALATVLASPFVGVSNDALVLIRRHAGEAAALRRHRALAARAALRGRRAPACARSSSGTSGSSPPRRACRSSGSARRSSRRTTTTSPCSRSGTASVATRTCAS